MVRRSRLEIYFDILEVIEGGTSKPTRIMYKTNLSWNTMHSIFETLIEGGFIREVEKNNSKRYDITDKGRRALAYHRRSLEGLIKVRQSFRR